MKNSDKLVEIFIRCDDFCKEYQQRIEKVGLMDPIKKTLFTKK